MSCAEKGSHSSPDPDGAAAAVRSASAGAGTWLSTAAMLAMMITAATARAVNLERLPAAKPPQRPRTQLPMPTRTSRTITRATRLGSVWRFSTQSSQTTVAIIRNPMNCLNDSIQAPGFGTYLSRAGTEDRVR